MTRPGRWVGAAVGAGGLVASLAAAPPLVEPGGSTAMTSAYVSSPASVETALPLAGIRIALDPGHQLGNHNFRAQIRQLVPAGGFDKPCNTTGTATNGGYPEATLNFRVARLVKARLEALGAQVSMTRTRNSEALWGPCVDARGEFGARVHARLTVSLHGDGAPSGDHGFHVIAPVSRSPWTTDIARASLRLAKALRAGFDARGIPRSTYVGNGTALSIRSDLGTLNMSDVPVAMIEVGNMRNSSDAHRMTTTKGRHRYARAVVRGIRLYLGR
ncbi:MAG TPA: N-acetylmuramoyl-L-alanine amidase [Marmoricola sp.]|nr:N-acetylmuramoyl-L-alanine amidase [Marmoricola sp.]